MRFQFVLASLVFAAISFSAQADYSRFSNMTGVHVAALFLQPNSDNLKYAVFVSGQQPLHQSWHNQEIKPGFSPALEIGFNYAFPESNYNVSLDWLYLNSNDSSSKQANRSTELTTVEFVAPPYDVGPAVFGIKHASSTVNFNFNNVNLNFGKTFVQCPRLIIKIFSGFSFLGIKQTITTIFNDYAGSPIIPLQAYALPADPSFYFQTQNTSSYTGGGIDAGVNLQYEIGSGFGINGQFLGMLTAGKMSVNDNFTSASARLLSLGIPVSHQAITAPSTTKVVPGFDSQFGISYDYVCKSAYDFKVEVGYRFAYYLNAIGSINPTTLVQAGIDPLVPEFATGTMAINSTGSSFSPFSFSGPYINFTVNLT